MIWWRVCKRRWAKSAFTGLGAAENPGRWNSHGIRAVYCSDSLALAALEGLVHVEDWSLLADAHFVAIEVEVPDELLHIPSRLPANWNRVPISAASREFGDRFLAGRAAPAMRIPTAVVESGFNLVLNPLHPDFHRIRPGRPRPFRFDRRLTQ
jgi:RES domain-containing protein